MHAWDSVDRNPSDLLKEIGEVAFRLLSWALASSWPAPLAAPARLCGWREGPCGSGRGTPLLSCWPPRVLSSPLLTPQKPRGSYVLYRVIPGRRRNLVSGIRCLLLVSFPPPTFPQLLHSLGPLEKGRRQNAIKVAFSEPLAFKVPLWGGWIQSTFKKKESFFIQTRSGWL